MNLERTPISVLIQSARKAGASASLAHTREELLAFLLDDEPLRPDPMDEIRRRIHSLIEANLHVIEDTIDPTCAACHRSGQKQCGDLRAITEYLENINHIFAGGHHETR